ncbi:MAG: MurT ligase domain-containing protein [Clostridiales Family XIII bacterium]|jgi:UDP-N-acetylmuramyl tripeptide synthase|nr:MurT ligase domain-containing protein [Clostridiales Family XIII bacterium]
MSSPRFAAALLAGKFCAKLCAAFFPKRGSNLPGEIALKLDPLFLRHITGVDTAKTIFITGTNGKSTANNMVVHAFRSAGRSVASNLEGANMKPGAAAALLKNTTAGGRFKKEYLILEVDERSLALIAKDLPPGQLCVANIQKDQVQRNGDPDYIYEKIKAVVRSAKNLTLFVNNDEPRSKSLGGQAAKGGRVVSFGVSANARASQIETDYGVTMPCPVCRDALVFTHFNIAGVGAFRCPSCGFRSDETPDYRIDKADFENGTFTALGETCRLAYPAAFFLYNYALCAAVCAENGMAAAELKSAFGTFANIGGRMEAFSCRGKTVRYMRIKQENPETLQSALDTMAEDKTEKVLVVGPAVVDDIVPHYSNTFYTFDCNFEPFAASGVERCICFGSTIGWDMANRLRYAGIPDEKIEIVGTDDDEKILAAIAACRSGNVYLITWIKKYEKLKGYAG